MSELSYTQEYFLCAVDKKGSIPAYKSAQAPACLLVGGIMELFGKGFIAHDEKNKLVIAKPLDDTLRYLKPLYEIFQEPQDAAGIAESYLEGSSQRAFDGLLAAFGVSLVKSGCADEVTIKGLFSKKTKHVPKPEAAARVIEKVRTGFLGGGAITDETLCVAALLDKGEFMRNFFSKSEAAELKKRIQEERKSDSHGQVKELLDYGDIVISTLTAVTSNDD